MKIRAHVRRLVSGVRCQVSGVRNYKDRIY